MDSRLSLEDWSSSPAVQHTQRMCAAAAAGSSLTRSFGKPCVLYARHVRTASTLLQLTTPTLARPCGRGRGTSGQAEADHTDWRDAAAAERRAVLSNCGPCSTDLEVGRHLVHDRQQLVTGITLVLHDERHLQSPTAVSPGALAGYPSPAAGALTKAGAVCLSIKSPMLSVLIWSAAAFASSLPAFSPSAAETLTVRANSSRQRDSACCWARDEHCISVDFLPGCCWLGLSLAEEKQRESRSADGSRGLKKRSESARGRQDWATRTLLFWFSGDKKWSSQTKASLAGARVFDRVCCGLVSFHRAADHSPYLHVCAPATPLPFCLLSVDLHQAVGVSTRQQVSRGSANHTWQATVWVIVGLPWLQVHVGSFGLLGSMGGGCG